jgi:hypothetical protein
MRALADPSTVEKMESKGKENYQTALMSQQKEGNIMGQ